MNTALDVARYTIFRSNLTGHSITNLKLQKLLYFVQAFFLSRLDEACFHERIEAWALGPVVPVVYHQFKFAGSQNIPASILTDTTFFENLGAENRAHIDTVIDLFADRTAQELVRITHNQTPWIDAYEPYANNLISIDAIRAYFS